MKRGCQASAWEGGGNAAEIIFVDHWQSVLHAEHKLKKLIKNKDESHES
jgi:hypothetical protein